MDTAPLIVGIGEALVDLFPDGMRLGGAPLKVAVHARQLGNQAGIISAVGRDEVGDMILAEIQQFGIDTQYIQITETHASGTVEVSFDENGEPQYKITENVAWDHIQAHADNIYLPSSASAICFGTLAQRHPVSQTHLREIIQASHSSIKLYDINLRPGVKSQEFILPNLELATHLKVNEDELKLLGEYLDLPSSTHETLACLGEQFGLNAILYTRGKKGCSAWDAAGFHEAEPVEMDTSQGNPVGAGDSTAAAVMHGWVRGWSWERTLKLANHLGAYVASQPGACPALPAYIREIILQD